METKNFITDLINSGSDANLNLYEVSIFLSEGSTDLNNKNLNFKIRTTTFAEVVTRNLSTVSLPYQNINIEKVSPSTEITKIQSFTIRLDDNYQILKNLRDYQCIDSSGYFSEDKNKKIFKIRISALKDNSNLSYIPVYTWDFKYCYILSIEPLQFSYDSSSQASLTVRFVWGDYEEGECDITGNIKK